MIISVRLPAALAAHAEGHRHLDVDVVTPATVEAVVSALGVRFPAVGRRIVDETGSLRRHVNVYVGDEECRQLDGLGTPVPEGVTVQVIGAISGG